MKNQINYLQLCSLLLMIIVTSFLGVGFIGLIKVAQIDAWLSIIIGGIIGIILICAFIYIFNYEPDLSINQKITKLFGKKLGFIINTINFLIILMIGINMMYNLVNFIVSQFLSETPYWLIGILFSLIIILANIKGIETISRTSLILVVINLVLFLISVMGLLPEIKIDNFKPFLEYGINRSLLGSIYIVTVNILPIFALLIIPKKQILENKHYKKYFFFNYILVIIIMLITLVDVIGNLGIELTSNYQYPEYILLKRISIFNFLDRIENVLVIQWIFGIFITISMVVYYLSNSIKYNHQNKFPPILITTIILILALTLFPNNTMFNQYSYYIVPYIRAILLISFILISIKIKLKRKSLK